MKTLRFCNKILINKKNFNISISTTSFNFKRETNSNFVRTSPFRNFTTENKDDKKKISEEEINKQSDPNEQKIKEQLSDSVNKLDWDQLFQTMKKNPNQFAEALKKTGLDVNSKPFPGLPQVLTFHKQIVIDANTHFDIKKQLIQQEPGFVQRFANTLSHRFFVRYLPFWKDEEFLEGAKLGFQTIIKLHSEGDREALKRYVHKSIQPFITAREGRMATDKVDLQESSITRLHCFPSWEREAFSFNFVVDVSNLYSIETKVNSPSGSNPRACIVGISEIWTWIATVPYEQLTKTQDTDLRWKLLNVKRLDDILLWRDNGKKENDKNEEKSED